MKKRKYSVSYSNEIYGFLINNSNKYTIKQLVGILKNEYNFEIERKKLAQYCIKMGITYKYEKPNKSHSNKPTPIGAIARKTDGDMLKVKIGNHKWKYLQREIYEKHHKVKLKNDEYIIFLDQNKRNFDINNLKLISRQESAMLGSQQLYSKYPLATETGLKIIKLRIKTKEKEGIL